jgi:hypothetical protein
MEKAKRLTIVIILLVTTALYTFFVFIPNINPDRVVDTSEVEFLEVEETTIDVFNPISFLENSWPLEQGKTNIVKAEILNRELPTSWDEKDIFFKYTYLGEYSDEVQNTLDELMATEYRWENQLDESGNIVMGGPILKRDGIYQLHSHNAFSLANKYFLLGELTARYSNTGELVGTEIMLGNVKLRAIWEKDTRLLEDDKGIPGAQLIISTCLEIDGDRRLLTGWEIVQ